jgi:membrane protease YdiL (CAAX protease family)
MTLMALGILWLVAAAAAAVYTLQYGIPVHLALAVFPAFLLEITFYYGLGMERWRARLEKWPPAAIGLALTLAAVAPYCAASLALRNFDVRSLGWLTLAAALVAFWYVVLPHRPLTDLAFVAFLVAMWLTNLVRGEYVNPHPKLRVDVLGQLMWIRTGALAMLTIRRVKGVGFGFWPKPREWTIGLGYFAALLPVAAAAAWEIGFTKPHLPSQGWERDIGVAVGTFFGVLWVVALGEEFFFRGLLQQWFGRWLKSEWTGLLLASATFGAVHLWFRAFPNWRLAILAGIAGVFYGLAFRSARSIRASMVTHALTVTTWRLFF